MTAELLAAEGKANEEMEKEKEKLWEQFAAEKSAQWGAIFSAIEANIAKLIPKYEQWLEHNGYEIASWQIWND